MTDAELSGYFRHKVEGVHYPAVAQRLDSSVKGKIIIIETDEEVALLEEYEGTSYRTILTEVLNLESGEKVIASVYVWGEDTKWLLNDEWNYDNDFRNPFIAGACDNNVIKDGI